MPLQPIIVNWNNGPVNIVPEDVEHEEPVLNNLDAFLKAHTNYKEIEKVENTLDVPIDSFYNRHTKQRYTKEMIRIKHLHHTGFDIDNNTLVGIEVEVEQIPNKVDCSPVWSHKEDGSLRNDGIEYISRPIEAHYVPAALSLLKKTLRSMNEPEYTSRTSIHVHVNVQDMSFKQIQTMTILYLCFESLLYSYAGNGRNKSIFCVPLSHAGYVGNLREFFAYKNSSNSNFTKYFRNWHKYTGFNLHPVHTQGTIEFRHLSGTEDIDYISKWVALIVALKEAAMIYKLEDLFKVIADLNTNSEYYIFASSVFKDTLKYLDGNNLQEIMEKDISHIKECFFPIKKKAFTKEEFENSAFFLSHKIKEIEKEVSEWDHLSIDELEKLLKDLYTKYHASYNEKERSIISKQYGEVNTAIQRYKLYNRENF